MFIRLLDYIFCIVVFHVYNLSTDIIEEVLDGEKPVETPAPVETQRAAEEKKRDEKKKREEEKKREKKVEKDIDEIRKALII